LRDTFVGFLVLAFFAYSKNKTVFLTFVNQAGSKSQNWKAKKGKTKAPTLMTFYSIINIIAPLIVDAISKIQCPRFLVQNIDNKKGRARETSWPGCQPVWACKPGLGDLSKPTSLTHNFTPGANIIKRLTFSCNYGTQLFCEESVRIYR
jgi:hypothetical protein